MFSANRLEIVLATLAHMSQWLFVVTFSFERRNILLSVVLFCSPSGKLVQIEYALAAVAAGAPSVGIKGIILKVLCVLQMTQKKCVF